MEDGQKNKDHNHHNMKTETLSVAFSLEQIIGYHSSSTSSCLFSCSFLADFIDLLLCYCSDKQFLKVPICKM